MRQHACVFCVRAPVKVREHDRVLVEGGNNVCQREEGWEKNPAVVIFHIISAEWLLGKSALSVLLLFLPASLLWVDG